MVDVFLKTSPVMQAFIATLFTWGMTALGASSVFFFKQVRRRSLDFMLGFAAGVMISASFWSLLAPSMKIAEEIGQNPWFSAACGFLSGSILLYIIDKLLPHMHNRSDVIVSEGIKTNWTRNVLLIISITLHNIPEGLAVGVVFGALASGYTTTASAAGALVLTLGMGMQNLPEGAAISIPLRKGGMSRRKSFFYGQLTGMVEPFAGIVGALVVMAVKAFLPFALAFAAGAMIFVTVKELIPECQSGENGDLAILGTILGFTLMMVLDVALG